MPLRKRLNRYTPPSRGVLNQGSRWYAQPIGATQDLLQRGPNEVGVDRLNRSQVILTVRIHGVRVHAHRTRPSDSSTCCQVVELGRLHVLQQAPHHLRPELEHTNGLTALEQAVRALIIHLSVNDLSHVRGLLTGPLNELDRVLDQVNRVQPQEVHFDQT